MKKIAIIVALIFVFSFYTEIVNARKVLPQSKTGREAISRKSTGTGIAVNPKLRSDRKALLVYFSGLQSATNISYMLIYKTNGQDEGAGGSVKPSEGNASRELLFGTCSKNICRYHPNITNMKLEVTASLTSGKKNIKRYKIRI